MTGHFNGLTPAEAERLAMLSEEAGEIVQAVGKILRHGYDSHHPAAPETSNRFMLEREIADFQTVVSMMVLGMDIDPGKISVRGAVSAERKLRYSHHQRLPQPPLD